MMVDFSNSFGQVASCYRYGDDRWVVHKHVFSFLSFKSSRDIQFEGFSRVSHKWDTLTCDIFNTNLIPFAGFSSIYIKTQNGMPVENKHSMRRNMTAGVPWVIWKEVFKASVDEARHNAPDHFGISQNLFTFAHVYRAYGGCMVFLIILSPSLFHLLLLSNDALSLSLWVMQAYSPHNDSH